MFFTKKNSKAKCDIKIECPNVSSSSRHVIFHFMSVWVFLQSNSVAKLTSTKLQYTFKKCGKVIWKSLQTAKESKWRMRNKKKNHFQELEWVQPFVACLPCPYHIVMNVHRLEVCEKFYAEFSLMVLLQCRFFSAVFLLAETFVSRLN